nr:integrase, catalytic region, zinc finger, CCHC-type, peptidase aspartic, catalytic [Tanacetum cinerariifolium]
LDNTKTRRPQPRSNTKNDRVPSASKSSRSMNKEVKVEEHHRNLLLSKKNKHISSACNNSKIDSQDSRGRKHKANVSKNETQKKYQPKVSKPKNVGTCKSLATPKPRKPRFLLRWSPTCKMFDQDGKLVVLSNSESHDDCSNGVDLLKGDRSTNLYTINLHEMASASPICLMARASSTKSWLWHQRLSHLNFDTINDLARNDLVAGLPKFKYHKEHLCPSCEQGKSKRASHPPKPVPNSRQRLHLLHMDLCGLMRIASINGKRYILVIIDDYSRYTWVHFLRSKDKAPAVIITFLKWITVLLQKSNISFLHVFGALCYPKNDLEDIRKLGAKGDIGFFIGYSADSCAYRIYNRQTKKIMETMNVSFDELSAMAFEQRSSKPGLQCMTSGQISSGLDLTYVPSTITKQQPTEGELDLLFEVMYDDYFGGQPSTTVVNVPPAQEPQVRQTSTASTIIADNVPIPTNSSSHATNIPITSQNVNELNPNAMVNGNTFVNPFATSSSNAAETSSSQNMDPSNMHTFYQPYPHEFQWTKDHPLEQVIGEPSRPVLTRNQLRSDGDMCIYTLTVSTMEPKNVKQAMTDPAWIESMQEELLQFKRIDVWVLVPIPYNISPLTLKWIFKNKHDEEQTGFIWTPPKGFIWAFGAMYDDYIGGQPSATARTVSPIQEPQVRQSPTTSTTIADIAPIPTNSSSHATNVPITSQDVDELNSNAMVDDNTFVNPFANPSTSAAAASSRKM